MARKRNIENHGHENQIQGEQPRIVPVMLITGNWKNFLTEYESKTIIARCLNYCVFENGLVVTGYLITNEKVYLVLKIKSELVNRILMIFFEKIKRSLRKHFVSMAKKGVPFLPAHNIFESGESYTDLFEEYVFDDPRLVELLTGNKPELTYDTDQLKQMKIWLGKCDFCSFNDYGGAIGQVVLNHSPGNQISI